MRLMTSAGRLAGQFVDAIKVGLGVAVWRQS
jgi:hypothetical protein